VGRPRGGPRVLAAGAPVLRLLLGEPVSVPTGADVIELLHGLAARRGTTVVVATHDASLAARALRRIGMRDGRVAEDCAVAVASP
jgi:predicted ABC-type transport system involved in lysophospholipase L1 biosynthesis ATPase subunit